VGKWAQKQHRGGGGNQVAAIAPPELTPTGAPDLIWTWDGDDPVEWTVNEGPTALGPWTVIDNPMGSSRNTSTATAGLFYYLFGDDGIGNPVTPNSNVVEEF
jgi:hypothetical protein